MTNLYVNLFLFLSLFASLTSSFVTESCTIEVVMGILHLDAPLSPEFQLRQVYPELLDAVADCISYEVIEVGLELGFTFEEILRFRMKYSDPLQTNREMLREWQRRNKREGKATIAWLTHCLLNTRSDIGTLIELEEKAFQESRQTPEKKRCSIA